MFHACCNLRHPAGPTPLLWVKVGRTE
jgi:hypothetical protein